MSASPVRLVTSAEVAKAEVVELLEAAIRWVREADHVSDVVVALHADKRVSVKYIGRANDLLALGARVTHEVNQAIDEGNT